MKLKINRTNTIALGITVALSFTIGGILIAMLGFNPFLAYYEMLKGIFVGKLNIGSVFEKLTPIFLTGISFVVANKVGFFNLGIEGQLCMGAITSAILGSSLTGLPGWLVMIICIFASVLAGALWAMVAAVLKAKWNINELCTTIMLNYIATLFASYLVIGPFGAKMGAPQTPYVLKTAMFARFLKPSRTNTGIFLAIIIFVVVCMILYKTALGYKITSVGSNAQYSDYIGIPSHSVTVFTVMAAGGIAGIAGCIEVLGVYGTFIDGMLSGVASDGILVSMISQMNIFALPFVSLAMSALKVGGLGMERFTSIPKSIVDLIIAMVIIFICIDGAFKIKPRKKNCKGWFVNNDK